MTELACPAALPIAETRRGGPGIVCGVLHNEDRGLVVDGWQHQNTQTPLIVERDDPSVTTVYCKSGAVMCGYQRCALWRGDKEREWAKRREGPGGLQIAGQPTQPDVDAARDRLREAGVIPAGV